MSLINDQVWQLREQSKNLWGADIQEIKVLLIKAADTIEELSVKLAAANMERSNAFYNAGWIPVTERMPEKSGFYIVTKKQRSGEIQVAIGAYQQPFNTWSGNGNFKDVIAWMPLAEPYEGDRNE